MSGSKDAAARARPRPAQLPLQGVRILSVEQFGAGPYGSMFLAHLGAEVIKIENPAGKGDPSRQTGPFMLGPDDSQYFQGWNSNKRSVTLDLKSAEGREHFESLVTSADAVVNNLRGDLPAKLRLDYPNLAPLNAKLVCLHISAYGRDNQRASWPGYDFLMQAEAGLMSITGEPTGSPSRFGPSIIDYMTGTTGMVGLLSALLSAQRTGLGCDVDTCLFDVALHQLGYAATWYLNTGHVTQRLPRNAHFSITPVQTYTTADGWIYIMCMTEKFWVALARALGREDLCADPRFVSIAARTQHRDALTEILDAAFRQRSTTQWLQALSNVLPVAPVYDLVEALENPFVAQVGMVSTVPHPMQADFRMLSSPLKINGQRPLQQTCSALGADNEALLPSHVDTAQP